MSYGLSDPSIIEFYNLNNPGSVGYGPEWVNWAHGDNIPNVSNYQVDIPNQSGDMIPQTGARNALTRINPRNPLGFPVPETQIPKAFNLPDIEIPTRGLEMVRQAGQQSPMLTYSGSDAGVVTGKSSAPPRPIGGALPSPAQAGGSVMNPSAPYAATNASALTPVESGGGLRPPFASMQPPIREPIEGVYSVIDERPVPVNTQTTTGGGSGARTGRGGANPSGRGPIYAGHDIPALSGPAQKPTLASRIGGIVRGLSANTVPTIAGGFAQQIQNIEYPTVSDADMLYLAESDPVFYAANKEKIDELIKQTNNNRTDRSSNPVYAPFGQQDYPSYFNGEFGRVVWDNLIGVPPNEVNRRTANKQSDKNNPGPPSLDMENAKNRGDKIILGLSSNGDNDIPTDMNERIMRSQSGFDAKNQEAILLNQGYTPVTNDFISADGSKPANLYYKSDNGKTRYEIPGLNAIGGGTGYAEFQGKRKGGGSFSVVPGGLTEGEKRQLAEINAREQQQREQDQLAAFMDRFTQPPGNMNPLQTQLWLNQQQQLGNFVKMQTEQQAAARLKQMELEREQAKQNREQANEDRRFYAGRDDAAVNQFDQAEQRRLSALQHGQQKNNDLMKLANEWTKRYQVEKLDEMGGKSYALDTSRYARENAISDEPSTNELRPGQVYHSPSRGGFVVYDNNGTPAYFSLTDMVYAQLYNRLGGR